MVRHSVIEFERWGSRRSSLPRDHPGRIPTPSVSSVRSAVNVWITLSSSTSVTCAASYRAIFNIIMTPEHISRSTRTAHGLVACNFPPSATLLPSPRSAVCIIATSVELHDWRGGTLSPTQLPFNSFLSKDSHRTHRAVGPPPKTRISRSGLLPFPGPCRLPATVPRLSRCPALSHGRAKAAMLSR